MKKIFCAAFVLALFSCKKEDKTVELTKENLVGTWKQSAETTNGINSWNSAAHESCELDNHVELKNDNTYVMTDAGEVCSQDMTETGAWSLNGKEITMDAEKLSVDNFDGKTLVLRFSESYMGTEYTVISTFQKQ